MKPKMVCSQDIDYAAEDAAPEGFTPEYQRKTRGTGSGHRATENRARRKYEKNFAKIDWSV